MTSMPPSTPTAPALEGWFTLDAREPQLLGTRCKACGTYYFPKLSRFCRNPNCEGDAFEEVKLSRTGRLWSYTNASYPPPEPYVAVQPFTPFAIAAVELRKEKMIVLGAVVDGVSVKELRAGMAMELAIEPLGDGKLIYKWKPVGAALTPSPSPGGRGESHLASPSGRGRRAAPGEGG